MKNHVERKKHRYLALRLCRTAQGNALLKKILSIAISTIYRYFPEKTITDIQITGSVANGEGTVIVTESEVVSSDLDILVCMKLPSYVLAVVSGINQEISAVATSQVLSMGIKTHIHYTFSSSLFHRILRAFQKSYIYDYEFSSNKSLIGKQVRKHPYPPSDEDALHLTFTIMAEYLMLYPEFRSKMEKVYWLIKRNLTLLYSMLIFEKKPKLTYAERVRTAQHNIPSEVIRPDQMTLMNSFLNFKLKGDPRIIFKFFGSEDIGKIIALLDRKLLETLTTVLSYGISTFLCDMHDQSKSFDLMNLINVYFTKTKKSLIGILSYALVLSTISIVTRRSNMLPFTNLALSTRHSLLSIADYLVALTLLSKLGFQNARIQIKQFFGSTCFSHGLNTIKKTWILANELKYVG